jgi:glycosyltransferase involved in cell wall biosynthesis
MQKTIPNIDSPLFANEICIIIPTYNRTKQLTCLLKTITQQTVAIGSIIVADGMGSAKEVVAEYQDKLTVKWINCPIKGQIPQRHYALKELPANCKVVIYFDDDIQLESNAIEEMIEFWNNQLPVPAGVSFNISNLPDQSDNIFRHLFCMASEPRGKVWKSGYNSPCGGHNNNMLSEWLPGGVTAWRRDIMDKYSIPDISSRWAVCEDLIFSYPIGKKESLYFCEKAKVKHIDDVIKLGFRKCLERGKNTVLWRLYFVSSNPDLSVLLFYWMNIGLLLGYSVRSIKGRQDQLGFLVGTILGMACSLRQLLLGQDVIDLLK